MKQSQQPLKCLQLINLMKAYVWKLSPDASVDRGLLVGFFIPVYYWKMNLHRKGGILDDDHLFWVSSELKWVKVGPRSCSPSTKTLLSEACSLLCDEIFCSGRMQRRHWPGDLTDQIINGFLQSLLGPPPPCSLTTGPLSQHKSNGNKKQMAYENECRRCTEVMGEGWIRQTTFINSNLIARLLVGSIPETHCPQIRQQVISNHHSLDSGKWMLHTENKNFSKFWETKVLGVRFTLGGFVWFFMVERKIRRVAELCFDTVSVLFSPVLLIYPEEYHMTGG